MKKDFLIGFLSCSCLYLLLALTPINNRFDKERAIYDDLQNIYLNVQPRQYRLFTSTPNLGDLQDKEVVLVSTGTNALFTRIGQTRYYVNLSSR